MPLIYDGIGAEKGLSTCIDPAVLGLVQFPSRQVLATGAASGLPAVPLPDQVSSITATGGTTYTVCGTGVFAISLQAPQWSIFRTGPTAAFTDQWDTAADFVSQLGSAAQAGQLYHARVCNLSAVVETLTNNTGVTFTSTSILPNVCAAYSVAIASITPPMIMIVSN